jgi:hypothetical protein
LNPHFNARNILVVGQTLSSLTASHETIRSFLWA